MPFFPHTVRLPSRDKTKKGGSDESSTAAKTTTSGRSGFARLKSDLARFVKRRDAHEERYGHSPGYALVVLDGFDTASAADVSSLHGAWEQERPVVRYNGHVYDLSGIVFMTVFRSDTLAKNARESGWKTAIEEFYERSLLKDSGRGASGLTPAAAVGRMGGGVVLSPVSTDQDCVFSLPGGAGSSAVGGGGSIGDINGSFPWWQNNSKASLACATFILIPLFVLGWWRVVAGKRVGGGSSSGIKVRGSGSRPISATPAKSAMKRPKVGKAGKMTVKDLKAELKRRGEKTDGLKADLIQRLLKFQD